MFLATFLTESFSVCRGWGVCNGHIMGARIIEAVHHMFLLGKTLPNLNEVLICLIPKGEVPESLSQFRPISLSNVLLKVVSKILANRLKPLMTKLTNQFQSRFIPGRSTRIML